MILVVVVCCGLISGLIVFFVLEKKVINDTDQLDYFWTIFDA